MARTTTIFSTAFGAALVAAAACEPSWAQSSDRAARSALSAQAQAQAPSKSNRPRPRIRVTPAYPYRTFSTDYPVPYKYEYPGPGFVRQCTAWMAPENRVSGPVIVPKMRCWWQRG